MSMPNLYRLVAPHDMALDGNVNSQQAETAPLLFVSLLEFVSEIYQVGPNSC